jgi:hypothetical protein
MGNTINVIAVKLFQYNNNETIVYIDSKSIESIHVIILSGDETIRVKYADGSVKGFDSSPNRIANFFDCDYAIETPEAMEKWVSFRGRPLNEQINSYARAIYMIGG